MNSAKLTFSPYRAHKAVMRGVCERAGRAAMLLLAAMFLLATGGLAGCITLEAPDEPIVIELNINITQEVIYRLAQDAGTAIEENPDIF